MASRAVHAAIVALALALVGSPAAHAAAESEPNDDIAHASGPLAGGVAYDGSFSSGSDVDWFVLYTNPRQPIDIAVTKLGDGCSGVIEAVLLDGDGRRIDSLDPGDDATQHFSFTTPAEPARYYVVLFNECAGDPYRLQADPPAAVTVDSPLRATQPTPNALATGEPNEDVTQAFGPLAGATAYAGDFASATDEDWFVLYTNPQQPLDIALTKVGDGCSGLIEATLLDRDGRRLATIEPNDDSTRHFNFTTPAQHERYYVVVVNDCAGDPYQLRADPAAAVATDSPLRATQPAPAASVLGEPNETLAAAFGPVAGATIHGGDFNSATDVDHVLFFTSGRRPVDVAVTKVGPGCSGALNVTLLDPSGDDVADATPGSNETAHFSLTAPRATAYVVRLEDSCAGDPYQLRIDPAGSVSLTPPPLLRATRSRTRRFPFRITMTGSALAGVGIAGAQRCGAGHAIVRVAAGRRTLARRRTGLRPDCSFAARHTVRSRRAVGRARRLSVSVRFRGSPQLERVRARSVSVRAR